MPPAGSARQWGRIGAVGFGGPPAHVTLLRELCVERRRRLGDRRLEGAGPAAVGAILGSAVPLARALEEPWQAAVLTGAAVMMLAARR